VAEEAGSADLERYLASDPVIATSRLALVKVRRATRIANLSGQLQHETRRLLDACLLVDVTDRPLRSAAPLASRGVRTLDAILSRRRSTSTPMSLSLTIVASSTLRRHKAQAAAPGLA